jgi:hypothetical protein
MRLINFIRWQVVAPTGLAHATTADDEYEGFRIPKGTTVWGNIKFIRSMSVRARRKFCSGDAVAKQAVFVAVARCVSQLPPCKSRSHQRGLQYALPGRLLSGGK